MRMSNRSNNRSLSIIEVSNYQDCQTFQIVNAHEDRLILLYAIFCFV